MTLESLALRVLTEPSPDVLWALHPHLLALDGAAAQATRDIAHKFYAYLTCVHSKLSSRQYSALAATLAAGSVGTLSVQEVFRALQMNRASVLHHLLVGGVAQGLEILSTRQHIKAWEMEFAFMHEDVVWTLYDQWWALSVETQPDITFDERRALVDVLVAPVRDTALGSAVRVAMALRLFQLLLLIRLAPMIPAAMASVESAE